MMNIVIKELKPEVKSLSGWIVYVMAGNVAVEAETCELLNLINIVRRFKTKYKI
jgi:hypothetical protein